MNASNAGKVLGSIKTEAKAKSSRQNGLLGGRPATSQKEKEERPVNKGNK
jgi:hypothetical protein